MTRQLPNELSAEEWELNKGSIAKKTGGTTGLTEALKALKIAWGKSDWEIVQGRDYSKLPPKFIDAAKLWKPAEASDKSLSTLVKELFTIENLAKDVAEKWTKSLLVPEKSATYVKSVMQAARSERLEVEEKQREIRGFCDKVGKLAKQEVNALLLIAAKPMPLNYIGLIKLVREFQAVCLKTPNTHLVAWAKEDGKTFLTDAFYNEKLNDEQAKKNAGKVQASLKELHGFLS